MDKRDIATLITKLNDRNLQRRRESGITNYILISILIIIIFKLIELAPILLNENDIRQNLTIILCTLCISFGLCQIIITYTATIGGKNRLKLISKEVESESFIEHVVNYLIALIPLSISVSLVLFFGCKWFPIVATIYFSLIVIFFIFLDMNYGTEKKFQLTKVEGSGKPADEKSLIVILSYIIAVAWLFTTIVYIVKIDFIVYNNEVVDKIKFGLLLYSIPFILNFIFDLQKKSLRNKLLEDIEAEIYLNNLTDDEIKDRLREKYMGVGIDFWIERQAKMTEELIHEIDFKLGEIAQFRIEAEKVDKTKYPREFKERKKEIGMRLNGLNDDLDTRVRKLNHELANIRSEDANDLEGHELKLIQTFVNEMQKKISSCVAKIQSHRH